MNTPVKKELTVIESMNVVYAALEKAQSKGVYIFADSAEIYKAITVTQTYFQNVIKESNENKKE